MKGLKEYSIAYIRQVFYWYNFGGKKMKKEDKKKKSIQSNDSNISFDKEFYNAKMFDVD